MQPFLQIIPFFLSNPFLMPTIPKVSFHLYAGDSNF